MEVYDYEYKYNFKILYSIYKKYGDVFPVNKNGEYSHRRSDINTEDKNIYGFCKACKFCNVRTKKQIKDLYFLFCAELDSIRVNLYDFLKGATNVKRIGKDVINDMEIKLKNVISLPNRVQWILKNGYVLNVFCKDSVPEFMKNLNLNEYFNHYMHPRKFGFVDYHYGILLVDNINLSAVNRKVIKTDAFGRVKIRSSSGDETYRRYLQLNTPNTIFRYWNKRTDDGRWLNRLYNANTNKYIAFKKEDFNSFTPSTLLKINNVEVRNKILHTKKIFKGVINK